MSVSEVTKNECLAEISRLRIVKAALENEIASLRIKQQLQKEACAICGGDLKWPDGKIHAKVCWSCFGKLAQAGITYSLIVVCNLSMIIVKINHLVFS